MLTMVQMIDWLIDQRFPRKLKIKSPRCVLKLTFSLSLTIHSCKLPKLRKTAVKSSLETAAGITGTKSERLNSSIFLSEMFGSVGGSGGSSRGGPWILKFAKPRSDCTEPKAWSTSRKRQTTFHEWTSQSSNQSTATLTNQPKYTAML